MLHPEQLRGAVLCWLATADAHGQANVSPKEIFALADETHLLIADIASPESVRNIAQNPRVCVSFVDVFLQKGYKIKGRARCIAHGTDAYSHWVRPLLAMTGERFEIRHVIVVDVSSVEPILAPSYRFYPDEVSEATQIASAMKAYGVRPVSAKD